MTQVEFFCLLYNTFKKGYFINYEIILMLYKTCALEKIHLSHTFVCFECFLRALIIFACIVSDLSDPFRTCRQSELWCSCYSLSLSTDTMCSRAFLAILRDMFSSNKVFNFTRVWAIRESCSSSLLFSLHI